MFSHGSFGASAALRGSFSSGGLAARHLVHLLDREPPGPAELPVETIPELAASPNGQQLFRSEIDEFQSAWALALLRLDTAFRHSDVLEDFQPLLRTCVQRPGGGCVEVSGRRRQELELDRQRRHKAGLHEF